MQFSNSPLKLVRKPVAKTIGQLMKKEGALEREAENDYINHFEIWDRVEIKFNFVTHSLALQSFDHHDLNYMAAI